MYTGLKEGERLDDIGFGKLSVIQKPTEFCYGIDAVLLADFARLKNGYRAVDLGTGTGVIPLILSHKTKTAELWGVEIQETSFERAARSVAFNGLSERIHLLHGDVNNAVAVLGAGTFDAVISNPPYNGNGDGLQNENEAKRVARHETTATLDDFMAAAEGLLRDRGNFYLIHRPTRLVDIFFLARKHQLEPKEMQFVAPDRNRKPNMVLVHCVKNGGPELTILDPLYIYNVDGEYTTAIKRIYEK